MCAFENSHVVLFYLGRKKKQARMCSICTTLEPLMSVTLFLGINGMAMSWLELWSIKVGIVLTFEAEHLD